MNPSTNSQVRDFIVTNFYVSDPAALADDASLLDVGIMDSTGVLEVISFLEDHFDIEVREADMVPDNLDSIERIARYVERRRYAEQTEPLLLVGAA
jgi:acyl carrier protein